MSLPAIKSPHARIAEKAAQRNEWLHDRNISYLYTNKGRINVTDTPGARRSLSRPPREHADFLSRLSISSPEGYRSGGPENVIMWLWDGGLLIRLIVVADAVVAIGGD